MNTPPVVLELKFFGKSFVPTIVSPGGERQGKKYLRRAANVAYRTKELAFNTSAYQLLATCIGFTNALGASDRAALIIAQQ